MFGAVLFPDGTGDSASWMYIPCLMDGHKAGSYSWGSVVLAFLYQQLCEGCCRRSATSSLGGCVLLLQVPFNYICFLLRCYCITLEVLTFLLSFQLLMWMRLPVGLPRVYVPDSWSLLDVPDMLPTAGYLWDKVSHPYTVTTRAYTEFNNELDTLTPSTVIC